MRKFIKINNVEFDIKHFWENQHDMKFHMIHALIFEWNELKTFIARVINFRKLQTLIFPVCYKLSLLDLNILFVTFFELSSS